MNIIKLSQIAGIAALTVSGFSQAVLGPIPIYLNTEYRTESPAIGSIGSTLSFNAEDIKATGANTFLEFLSTVPSVGLVDTAGNVPAIFIRGNEARHTLVLVDGVNIHDISSTDAAVGYGLSTIAINDIEKVDIVKGSGSVLYGSSAIAGVINIISKKGVNAQNTLLSTKFGTNNSRTYALSANGGSKDGFIRFTHNQYTTDGIDARISSSGETGEKDSIENRATQIKLGTQHYHITYLESSNKTEYDNWNGADNNNLSKRNLQTITFNSDHEINDLWGATTLISQTKSKRDSGSNASTSGDKFESTNITVLNDIQLDNALLNIGLSRVVDKNKTTPDKVSSNDVFANWQKNINDLDVNAGVRHTRHNKFGSKSIYGLTMAKYLDNAVKVTGGYNTAFNAPSLFYLDNSPLIKPEEGSNIEIGVERQYDNTLAGVKLFNSKIKESITYDGSWNGANDYQNTGKLLAKGIELYANTSIDGYHLDISHHYIDSKLNNETTQSIRRPRNTTDLIIKKQYKGFDSRVQITKKSSSLDDTNSDGVGDVKLPGYTLVNLSSKYAINTHAEVSLIIKNATDKTYETVKNFNNPGRAIEIGLDYNF